MQNIRVRDLSSALLLVPTTGLANEATELSDASALSSPFSRAYQPTSQEPRQFATPMQYLQTLTLPHPSVTDAREDVDLEQRAEQVSARNPPVAPRRSGDEWTEHSPPERLPESQSSTILPVLASFRHEDRDVSLASERHVEGHNSPTISERAMSNELDREYLDTLLLWRSQEENIGRPSESNMPSDIDRARTPDLSSGEGDVSELPDQPSPPKKRRFE